VLAGCLVAVVIGGWEIALRAAGLLPEYTDNRALWLSARHQLSRPDDNVIAILGASRIQRAVHVDVLSESLGRPVVQLAIEGSSGLPVLENLAADPRFRGTVIFSIAPPFSFNSRLSKLDAGNQADWMRAYVVQSRSRRMEQEMRLDLQGLFAFRAADASVSRTIPFILESGRFPGPDFKTIFRNRFVSIDLSRSPRTQSQQSIVEMYRKNSLAYEQQGFSELLDYFGVLVDFLNAKGSRVFVLRLPTEGAVLDYERQTFPKGQFWDQMEQRLAARFVHFDDYPELEGYLSADGSHIASEKAAEFTTRLATVLGANGL
jgi:hypothetical protein